MLIVVVLVITLGIKGVYSYHTEVEQLETRLQYKGESLAQFLASISPQPILSYDLITLDDYVEEITRDEDVIYALIENTSGQTFSISLDLSSAAVARLAKLKPGNNGTVDALRHLPNVLHVSHPVKVGRQTVGTVFVGLTREHIVVLARQLLVQEMMIGLGIILLLVLCIYVVFRYSALRPIQKLIHGSRRVAEGDFSQEIESRAVDELGQLTTAFNEMTRNLRHNIQEKDRILDTVQELNRSLESRVEERTQKLEALNRELEHLALHDPLTGLPNRSLIQDRIDQAILVDKRENNRFAIIMMDLNGFKEVNDTLGHNIGDQLLVAVATRLRDVLRAGDTVGRIGGDEFAILLQNANAKKAEQVAHHLAQAIAPAFDLDGLRLTVTASMGIAVFPIHGMDQITLLRHADVAMYRAKQDHHPSYVYDARHDHHLPDRLALITELSEAIRNQSLQLHYQPIVSLEDFRIIGVEALARWPEARDRIVSQEILINLIEQTELLLPFTDWLFESVGQQWTLWQQQGFDLSISINLCMRNIHDPGLVEIVGTTLNRYRMPPQALILEITESTAMHDPEHVRHVLQELTQIGVRISMDDFGTGYSSLSQLNRLPLHELKIDNSFIRHLAVNERHLSIVRSIVDLAHNLNLTVVAEGVEVPSVLPILQELQCDFAQGYYLGAPMSGKQVEHFLVSRVAEPGQSKFAT